MPTVQGQVKDISDTPIENVLVRIRNVSPVAFVTGTDDEVRGHIRVRTDEDGEWSTNLIANADLTPANTYYIVDIFAPGGKSSVEILVPDGAGPYEITDITTSEPPVFEVTDEALLAAHNTDAGAHTNLAVTPSYAQSIAGTIVTKFTTWTDVADWGAEPDGVTDNGPAINNAIEDLTAAGTAGLKAATLYFQQPGLHITNEPLVLPRSGLTPSGIVNLEGNSRRGVQLRCGASFPTNRGIVEWTATTARAWEQRIAHLSFNLASIAGAKAIWHKANGTPGSAEWLQLDLENILIEASNTFHPVLIDLEVGVRYSKWENVFGDPSPGTNPQYDTLLIRLPDGTSSDLYADTIGMGYCKLTNIHPMVRRGGYTSLISGRVYESSFDNIFCNGGRSGNGGYGYRLTYSTGVTMINVRNEGQGELAQFRFEHSHGNTIQGFGLGTPDPTDASWAATTVYALGDRVVSPSLKGSGLATNKSFFTCTTAGTSGGAEPTWPATDSGLTVADGTVVWTESGAAIGNGIELVDSSDNEFINRVTPPAVPVFSNRDVYAVVLDEDSDRNEFRRFQLRTTVDGDPSAEIDDNGTDNEFSGITVLNASTKTKYTIPI